MKDFDYDKKDNSHYTVPSMYGKLVREQYNAEPKYCEPGKECKSSAGKGSKQPGPKGNYK